MKNWRSKIARDAKSDQRAALTGSCLRAERRDSTGGSPEAASRTTFAQHRKSTLDRVAARDMSACVAVQHAPTISAAPPCRPAIPIAFVTDGVVGADTPVT